MSNEELPQQDVETSDDQHNSSDGANASRKGQPWTEEEHLAFLNGLRALGKGNWRAISKSFVPSRTPTQVASHAQKHFMRVAGATKRKSRFTALEVEVVASDKATHEGECAQQVQGPQQCPEQAPASVLQPSNFPQMPAAFPAMPFTNFPFVHPMMFGFPGAFFPPFMCPPPAFAAAALTAMQKQGQVPVVFSPMFPMAAMAAMNPFFMAQHMAAAAQAAAANAAAAAQAAASGGGTTAATGGAAATSDTATSGDLDRRTKSAPGSPGVCKPEPQHARPAALAAPLTVGVTPTSTASEASAEGSKVAPKDARPAVVAGGLLEQLPVPVSRPEGEPAAFQSSCNSAFRPPQELKSEP